ncbi:GNAT family N-acetyltransferase [Streptomyces sp. NPDC002838]|uniref:GNAT family N-acetyltransferase n=1 Tax=Streptomyces sp. NPDC002838 TaxID=3154436 RepID=UPI003333A79A
MAHVDEQYAAQPFPDLHGPGIRLRPWDPESDADVATWLRGTTDPEFRRWNTPLKPVTDADGARESLRFRAMQAAEGGTASYCVTDTDTGTPLGHIGVNGISPDMRCARVGYWVLPEARGRRVATRALALTAHWALTDLGLHRLELDHAVGHEASCRIAERCGLRYEGTLRGAMFEAGRHDAFRDMHLHARLATDPEPTVGQRVTATATPWPNLPPPGGS